VIYTVIWLPAAEQELADLWLDPAIRAEITQAANQIDGLLKYNPDRVGESRDADQRVLFVAPLGVLYRIKPLDCMVEVIHVWKFA
jgi:hypothetical protein